MKNALQFEREPFWPVSVVTLALLSLASVVLLTPHGLGISPDSVTYLDAARRLATGEGLQAYHNGRVQPLVHFPPLYPLILSCFVAVGLEPASAARWFNVVTLTASALCLISLLRRYAASSMVSLLVGCGFVLSQTALLIHVHAWTEPLMVLQLLVLLMALARHMESGEWKWLLLAAGAAGVAAITRYAGGVLIAYVSVYAVVGDHGTRPRMRAFLVATITAAGPLVAWLLWNYFTTGTATNRGVEFHPPEAADFARAGASMGSWVLPIGPAAVKWVLAVVLLLGATWTAAAWQGSSVVRHAAYLLYAYVGFVLFARTFLDPWIPFNLRMFSPAFPLMLIIATATLLRARRFRGALSVGFALWLIGGVLTAGLLRERAAQRGWWLEAPAWRAAGLDSLVASLPANRAIYSNFPYAIYHHTGTAALFLPWTRGTGDRERILDYPSTLGNVIDDIAARRAIVVFNYMPGTAAVVDSITAATGHRPRLWHNEIYLLQ